MIPYIIYVALITAVCFLFYRMLLHRETFFRLNRWFFLCCLIGSFSIPLLHLPQGWSFRAKPHPVQTVNIGRSVDTRETTKEAYSDPDPLLTVQHFESSAPEPVSKEAIVTPSTATAKLKTGSSVTTFSNPVKSSTGEEGFSISLLQILTWIYDIYLCGALIFGFILLIQLAVLIYQVRSNPVIKDGIFRIVQTKGDRAPCSFGRYIFINPFLYDEETLDQILTHEKIHVEQRHSVDIMLAELCIVVQWFNPFAWFYRKALEDNLEFLTDAAIIRNPGTNSSQYQMSLLKVSAPHLPLSITSNYNQSLLKKRMIMMHAQKSSLRTTWKYLFLLPLLTGIVCIFNDTVAISQNPSTKVEQPASNPNAAASPNLALPRVQVSAMNTAQPGPAFSADPAKGRLSFGDTDITGPVRVSSVVTTSLSIASNPVSVVISDVAPIITIDPVVNIEPMPVTVSTVNLPGNMHQIDQRKGTWMATIRGDTVELTMKSEEGDGYRGYSTNSEMLMKSEFSSMPTGQKGDFTVTREAGTLLLHGVFDGDEGFGHYVFKENTDFQNYLIKAGITEVTDQRMFGVFFGNVTRAYVESLLKAGFAKMSVHSLIGMASMKVDVAYIETWKKLGYPDLQPHDLISLKSMKIDGSYLKELQDAGFKELAPHDLVGAKSVGVDAAYTRFWKQAGYTDYSIHDLISAKSVGLEPEYVQSWKQAGITDLTIRDLVGAKSTGIDPAYMQSWKDAGFTDLSIHDLISAKSVGIDPAYVQTWKQAGFTGLSIHELISAKSVGIEPAYVQKWKQAGYTDLSIHDLISAKTTGIDPDYIAEWKKAGFNDLSIHELSGVKSMGLTVAYAETWKQEGYKDFTIHDLISLKSQNIDGSYVDSWKSLGYSDLAAHELVALKSVGVNAAYLKEMEAVGYAHLAPHELISFKSQGITEEFVKGFQSLGFKDIPPHIIVEMKSLGVTPDYISTMKNKGFNSGDLQEYIKLKTFR